MKKETITDKRGYVYTQNKDSVTIRICGEAYANLRKIWLFRHKCGSAYAT